jgi:DNA repair protein RadC
LFELIYQQVNCSFFAAGCCFGSIKRNVICALSSELFAILLRVGVTGMNVIQLAQNLLLDHGGWAGLQRLSLEEMTKIHHGLGEAKAAQVKAALEIGRRLLQQQPEQRRRSPAQQMSPTY